MNYCKIYIDTELTEEQLEKVFALGFNECVSMTGVEYTLFSNDIYIKGADKILPPRLVERSRYYAEIDSEPEGALDESNFHRSIANLIIWLRQKCDFVVASCDFEDYIAETTGWNWTPEQPTPPSVLSTDHLPHPQA